MFHLNFNGKCNLKYGITLDGLEGIQESKSLQNYFGFLATAAVNFWTNSASYLLTCSRHPGRPQVPSYLASARKRHPFPIHLAAVKYFLRLNIGHPLGWPRTSPALVKVCWKIQLEVWINPEEASWMYSRFFVRICSRFVQDSVRIHSGFSQDSFRIQSG